MSASELSVLLIDDDPDMCEIFKLILGYHKIPVHTLSQANGTLEYLRSNKASLIIIDLYLPEIDGWQLLRQIRSSGLAKDSKFLALSAHYSGCVTQQPQRNAFDGFIPKPINVFEIVPYLKRVAGFDEDNKTAM